MTWKVPHYMTLGFTLLMTQGEGDEVYPVTLSADEIPEGGFEEMLGKLLPAFAQRGITPVSEEQYAQFCAGVASREQERRLMEAMTARARGQALSDGEADVILRAHKGEPQ